MAWSGCSTKARIEGLQPIAKDVGVGLWIARRNQIDEPFDRSMTAAQEQADLTARINQRH
jgi:hypothetical protein